MDCTLCNTKKCRSLEACNAQFAEQHALISAYHEDKTQRLVQSASELVDNGRAGTLSRLQEIIDFSKRMNFSKLGLAYCYGMEKDVKALTYYLKEQGFKLSAVSCTTGALGQDKVNSQSDLKGVSCNPIAQAQQLNSEGADLIIVIGLCLGHDIIFQKNVEAYTTTLVVKDRVYNHNPMEEINKIKIDYERD